MPWPLARCRLAFDHAITLRVYRARTEAINADLYEKQRNRWYDRHRRGGPEALADRPSRPDRVWNRIPEAIRGQNVVLAAARIEAAW